MALPHEHCGPGDVCCTSLYEVADLLLEVCHTAVVGCSTCDCELPGIVGYVSMGREIQDPTIDSETAMHNTPQAPRMASSKAGCVMSS